MYSMLGNCVIYRHLQTQNNLRKFLTDTTYHIVWQQDKDVSQCWVIMRGCYSYRISRKTIGDNRICKVQLTMPATLKC